MSGKPPLDEMWKAIEEYGIKRSMLDPNKNLPYEQVSDLYLTIKKLNVLNGKPKTTSKS